MMMVALSLVGAIAAQGVAVVPFGTDEEALAVASTLGSAALTLGFVVRPPDAVARDVEGAARLVGPCNALELECAARLGGLMGVDFVLVGKVERGQLIVRATDVAAVKLKGQAQLAWAPESRELSPRLAVVRLLRPDLERGTLVVEVDIAGASVVVDNQQRGASPIAPLSLAPGRHEVYVAHVDFESQTHVVNVPFEGSVVVTVRLDPTNAQGQTTLSGTRRVDEGFRKVAVVNVLVANLEPHAAPLLTLGLVDALQRLDELIVAAPDEWRTLVRDDGADAVASCVSDACYAEVFGRVGFDEVIVVTGEDGLLTARRVDVAGSVVGEGQVVAESDKTGQALGQEVVRLAPKLYPGRQLRRGLDLEVNGELRRRYRPAPLPIVAWGATAGVTAVGAATTALGGALLGSAQRADDATGATAILVVGAAVTAVGIAATIIEFPFVDWVNDAAANEALLSR